jgi:hypothetical protein
MPPVGVGNVVELMGTICLCSLGVIADLFLALCPFIFPELSRLLLRPGHRKKHHTGTTIKLRTRSNSRKLPVARGRPCFRAVAAIHRSFVPMSSPRCARSR